GIAEEVEERRPVRRFRQPLQHEGEMRLLLGEGADMPKRGEAAFEADRAVPADPALAGSRAAFPAARAFLVHVAGEDGVGLLPFGDGEARRPDRLLLGAVEQNAAEALELAP